MEHLKAKIRQVPDFPKPGILFYDITTLLRDPIGLGEALDGLTEPFRDKQIDLVAASRVGDSSSAPRSPTDSEPASCPYASRENCRHAR